MTAATDTAATATATGGSPDLGEVMGLVPWLRSRLLGQEAAAEVIAVAAVTGLPVSLVNPPGQGKTSLADAVGELIGGDRVEVVFNQTTTPDEVFGPVNVARLTDPADPDLVRITEGYVPSGEVVILDEPGKASSAVLNGLLPVLDGRRAYRNGRKGLVPCPWVLVVLTSNEPLPRDCGALKDRIGLRLAPPSLDLEGLHALVDGWRPPTNVARPSLDVAALRRIQQVVGGLAWSDRARDVLKRILAKVSAAMGHVPSPRTLLVSMKAAQGVAVLDGCGEVYPEHLRVLAHTLTEAFDGFGEGTTTLQDLDKILEGEIYAADKLWADRIPDLRATMTRVTLALDGGRVREATSLLQGLAPQLQGLKEAGTPSKQQTRAAKVSICQDMANLSKRVAEAQETAQVGRRQRVAEVAGGQS